MKGKILISGGTGLVGNRLKHLLKEQGYEVGILTRGKTRAENGITYYHWNHENKQIDPNAFKEVSYIVNLVGAGVAEKKWTSTRKKVILESRTHSTRFLYELAKESAGVKGFLSASAIGIYGNDTGNIWKTESSAPAHDFLAEVVSAWEKEALKFESLDVRTVILRIGVVLDDNGGALAKIAQPIKYGVGAPLGNGQQYMSWVHVEDLAKMFLWAIDNPSVLGVYNAVNPNPVTNKEFTSTAARILKKPLWLPNVPGFLLKLMLGEMSTIVLGGTRVSCEKLVKAGFDHDYQELPGALENLFGK